MSSLKGVPFPDRTARMKAAQRKVGFMPDEIYGGTLDADAVVSINRPEDAERYLLATRDDGESSNDGESTSIFTALASLQISASTIARTIADADASVKKSVRLSRAEEAADREGAAVVNDPAERERQDRLMEILAKRSRRRPLKKS